MTQEEKAKAYDEAIERAKEYFKIDNDNTLLIRARGTIEYLFPEIKESEDERIKEQILDYFKGKKVNEPQPVLDSWIAWLEKQGEQENFPLEQAANIFLDALSNSPYNNKPITDAQTITKQLLNFLQNPASYNPDALIANEQKFVVEPKFKVGDLIRHKEQGFTCKIIAVDTEYRLSKCNGTHLPFESQDAYELVEQNPSRSEEDEAHPDSFIKRYDAWKKLP